VQQEKIGRKGVPSFFIRQDANGGASSSTTYLIFPSDFPLTHRIKHKGNVMTYPTAESIPSRYAQEQYNPKVPTCAPSSIRLRFDGHYLHGIGIKYAVAYPAVSGKLINGQFDYSVENQKPLNQSGPIPEGEYWIQPAEIQENAWYRFKNSRAAWGSFWITIHPYPETNTYSRGGFFIHGGDAPGSAGCIDLSVHMTKFVETLLAALGQSKNCYIPLSVRYPK